MPQSSRAHADERALEVIVCDASRVTRFGWPHPFEQRPWNDIDGEFTALAERYPQFGYMSAIVKSVRSMGAEDDLAAFTSMHDLMVVAQPIPELPYDLVAVRAPGSLRAPSHGHVLIEHLSVTGHNDRIEGPDDEAVPLFWRYMIEKFGVHPGNE
jgi:hypothetical protein